MSAKAEERGAVPVGRLDALDDLGVIAVTYLRHWCAGPEAQATVWNEVATALGAAEGRRQLALFETLISTLVTHGRRPLMRHCVGCRCLGVDECVFAHLIAAAAGGEREEAAMFAALLVRPDIAHGVAAMAEEAGLALKRIALRHRRAGPPTATRPTHRVRSRRH